MLKVMTIVGTRPEIIRLSRTIALLDEHVEHRLVHTGQNFDYELNGVFFDELGIRKPDAFLEAAGATPAETIGQVIARADAEIAAFAPNAVLILGDTNSALAAIAAKRRKVAIFHMEAGNRCFDFRVPEEINRRIVDHISDINLTYSQIARDYLLREGLPPDQVIVTGSPMREVLNHYSPGIAASDSLTRFSLSRKSYFLVSSHREENVDDPDRLAKLFAILNGIADRFGLPVIVSTHPRTVKRIEAGEFPTHALVRLMKPFGFLDWARLQQDAKAVLSDSGTITEESNILNFPALNLRDVHERPEGFEEGAVMLTGLSLDRVLDGLAILETQPRGPDDRLLRLVQDYAPANVSHKVLRILMSYADWVDRRVWRKPGL
jgi:UDP-N-acetylglucosamine 2-epimerase